MPKDGKKRKRRKGGGANAGFETAPSTYNPNGGAKPAPSPPPGGPPKADGGRADKKRRGKALPQPPARTLNTLRDSHNASFSGTTAAERKSKELYFRKCGCGQPSARPSFFCTPFYLWQACQ